MAKKRPLRKDTIESIYSSNSASIDDRKKLSKSNVTTQKANATKSLNRKKTSTSQNDKATSIATRSLSPVSTLTSSTKGNDVTNKIQSSKSKRVTVKSKKGKNFILENKMNIKKISSANKLQSDDGSFHDIPQNVCNTVTVQNKDKNN